MKLSSVRTILIIFTLLFIVFYESDNSPSLYSQAKRKFATDSLRVNDYLKLDGQLNINGLDRAGFFDDVDTDGDGEIDSAGIALGEIDLNHCDDDLQSLITEGGGYYLTSSDGDPVKADTVDSDGNFHVLYGFTFRKSFSGVFGFSGEIERDTIAAFTADFLGGVYLRSDGKWGLAECDDTDTMYMSGICLTQTQAYNHIGVILKKGFLYWSLWTFTTGDPVWLSATGNLTQTRPTTSGHYMKFLGIARASTLVEIDIDKTPLVLE